MYDHRKRKSVRSAKKDEVGFLLLTAVVLVAIGLALRPDLLNFKAPARYASQKVSRVYDRIRESTVKADQTSQPPRLQNLGLAKLEALDTATGKAGDMVFTRNSYQQFSGKGTKSFYEFGSRSARGIDGAQVETGFSYHSLALRAQVIAATDGTVVNMDSRQENGTVNWEVHIRPSNDSSWVVVYDHLNTLHVKYGQTIKAGDLIGEAARENEQFANFSMRVQNGVSKPVYHCPASLLDPAVKETQTALLTRLMQDWNNYSGLPLYDLSKQASPGCLGETISAEQL